MAKFNLPRWLQALVGGKPKTVRNRRPRTRLAMEALEDRVTPANFTWTGASGLDANWGTPGNWAQNSVPGNGDDLVFPAGPAVTDVFNDLPANVAVNSLTFSGGNYTLRGNDLNLGSPAPNTGYIQSNVSASSGATTNVITFNIHMLGIAGNRQFFTVSTPNSSLRIDGQLIGPSGVDLSKDGAGTLILAGDNSQFTGSITIVEGVVNARSATALGSTSSPTIVLSSFAQVGQLQIGTPATVNGTTPGVFTIAEPLILNGAGPDGNGALLNISGRNILTGTVQLDSNATIGATDDPLTSSLAPAAAIVDSLTINGVISDTGAGHNLTKEGVGTVVFDPINTPFEVANGIFGNTYRGRTSVNAGILAIRHSLALGNNPLFVYGSNDTVVNSNGLRSGTLQIEFLDSTQRDALGIEDNTDPNLNAAGDGFTVPSELLTLNGPGFQGIHVPVRSAGNVTVSGALNNLAGNNTWQQDIALWSDNTSVVGDNAFWSFGTASPPVAIGVEANSTLTIGTYDVDINGVPTGTNTGHIHDDNLLGGTADVSPLNYFFVKTRPGRLVLVNANSYRGRTDVVEGFLNIRDSQALGTGTNSTINGTWVFPGATLELEADTQPDSQAGTPLYADQPHSLPHLPTGTDIIIATELLRPMGDGAIDPVTGTPTGAIRNIRGVNELTGSFQLQRQIPRGGATFFGTGASVGVVPDYIIPADFATLAFPDNDPFFYRSQLTISGSVDDDPGVAPSNLTKYGQGELVLTNNNTYTGQTFIREGWITARADRALGQDAGTFPLNTNPSTRPDTVQPETYIFEGAALVLKATRDLTFSDIALPERIFVSGNGVTHPAAPILYPLEGIYDPIDHKGAILNLSGSNIITGIVTLVATPTSSTIGLGADIDSTDPSVTQSVLRFGNLIRQDIASAVAPFPYAVAATPTAGFEKLGRKSLWLHGPGTYLGDNLVSEGVLRVTNDTALGMLDGTTTVADGAALEIAGYPTSFGVGFPALMNNINGGLPGGIQVRENLILNGSGNLTANDPTHDFSLPTQHDTVQNVDSDNQWRGPITLATDVTMDIGLNSRLSLWKTIDGPGGFTKNGDGKLILGGSNTYRGTTTINSGIVNLQSSSALGFGTTSEVQTITLGGTSGTFTLFFGVDETIALSRTATASQVRDALNQLPSISNVGGSVSVALSGNVYSVTFGGSLANKDQAPLTVGTLTGNTTAVVDTAVVGGVGGTVVANNAQIELQGTITISGETLDILGDGPPDNGSLLPPINNIPLRWFAQGPGPINNALTSPAVPDPSIPLGNVSGRVSSVAVDPNDTNVIYAGAAGGGLWRSRNNGATWEPLIDRVPGTTQTLFVGAIAVAPTNSRVIYVATGESTNPFNNNAAAPDTYYGRGVLISTDYGVTWSYIANNPGIDLRTVSRIAVDPTNPNNIYMSVMDNGVNGVTGNTGIWRCVGADTPGAAWTNLTAAAAVGTAGNPGDDWTDVVVVNNGAQIMLVGAIGNSNGGATNAVYVSLDGGTTWSNGVSNAYPNPDSTGFVSGVIKLAVTPRSGTNFRIYAAVAIPNTGQLYGMVTSAFTTTGFPGWPTALPGLPTGIAANITGGQAAYNLTVAAAPNPAGGNDVVFVGGVDGYINTAAVNNSSAVGGTFVAVNVPPPAGTIVGAAPHLSFHAAVFDTNNNAARLVVGTDGGIWRLETPTLGAPGNTPLWTNLNGSFLQITQFNGLDVDPFNPFRAVGGSRGNGTELYNDSPYWSYYPTETGNGGRVQINNKDSNFMYHFQDGLLRRTTDGGATWATILNVGGTFYPTVTGATGAGFPQFPFILDREVPSRLLVGVGTTLRESTNANVALPSVPTFNTIGDASDGFGTIYQIAVAQFQGSHDPSVLGFPYVVDPSFPNAPDKGADAYDADTIYVLTSNGVFHTKNHGQLWVQRNNGLPGPFNQYSDLAVDPLNRDIVYVVRRVFGGAQIYRSMNAGQTWSSISGNLPDLPTWSVVINRLNGDVYVGNDNGVYVLKNGASSIDVNGRYTLPTNAGSNWAPLGVGLPNVQAKTLVFNPLTNMLSAGTYGRGLYQIWLDSTRDDLTNNRTNQGVLRALAGNSVWAGDVTLSGETFIRTEYNAQVTLLGTITGDDTIHKKGVGRLVLSGDNSDSATHPGFTGIMEVEEGALRINNPFALGDALAPTNVSQGAALELSSDLFAETVHLKGDGVAVNGRNTGALRNVSFNNTFTGTLVLDSNTTIGVDSGSILTIGNKVGTPTSPTVGVITGLFGFTKELAGTLVLNAANDYGTNPTSGLTDVVEGALRLEHNLALGTAGSPPPSNGVIVRNGAQLQLGADINGNGVTIANEQLRLSGTGIFGTGALLNFAGDNVWSGSVVLDSIKGLAPPQPIPATVAHTGGFTHGLVSISVVNPADTLTITGVIDDRVRETGGPVTVLADAPLVPSSATLSAFDLTKIGDGRLALAGGSANLYTGVTTVAKGSLSVEKAGALGTAGASTTVPSTNRDHTVVAAGAALEVSGNVTFASETLILNGLGATPGNLGALRSTSGANTWTGPVVLNSTIPVLPASLARTNINIGADGGSELTLSGVLQDPTTVSTLPATMKPANWHKVGDGKVILPGGVVNTYDGITFVDQGILNIRSDAALGFPAADGTVVASGATLEVQGGFTETDEALTLAQNGALTNNGGANVWQTAITLTGNALLGANTTAAGDRLTITGPITDGANAFSITKVGPGTVEYAGGANNTYDGITLVDAGTLLLNKSGGTPFAGGLIVGLPIGAPDSATLLLGASNQIPDAAPVVVNGSGHLNLAGHVETLNTLSVNNGHVSTGAGLLTLNNSLNMVGGDIQLNTAGQRLVFGPTASLTFNSSGAETAVIHGPGSVDLVGAATRTFVVNNGPMQSDLLVSAPIAGASGETLTKIGFGLMEIDSNANTYNGLTIVQQGILQVDGVIGDVQLNGGTLGGIGTVGDGNPVVDSITSTGAAGNTINPGDSPGALTVNGNVTLNGGTTFFVELNRLSAYPTAIVAGTDYDQLRVNGNINLNNANLTGSIDSLGVGVVTVSPTGPDTFTILTYTGTRTGKFASGDVVFIQGRKFLINYDDLNKNIVLTKVKANVVVDITAQSPSSPVNPSVWGQPVTYEITVTPESGVGTGSVPSTTTVTVFLTDFTQNLPAGVTYTVTVALNNGRYVFDPLSVFGVVLPVTNVTPTPFAPHAIRAEFRDPTNNFNDVNDGVIAGSVPSRTITQTVNKAATSIALASSSTGTPPTSVFGEPVTVTATIGIQSPPGGILPGTSIVTGFVTFTLDPGPAQTVFANVPVFFDGNRYVATVPLPTNLARGDHAVSAVYSGDGHFLSVPTTTNLSQRVIQASSAVVISDTPDPTDPGQAVTFTINVGPASPSVLTPTGTVVVYDGAMIPANEIQRGAVNGSGQFEFNYSNLVFGIHNINVQYLGDVNFTGSTNTTQHTVKGDSRVTLGSSLNPSTYGQTVTFTATVAANVPSAPSAPIPTGTVDFFANGNLVADDVVLNAAGVATFTPSVPLGAGTHVITATYNGSSLYKVGAGQLLANQVINAAATTTGLNVGPVGTTVYGQAVTMVATVGTVLAGLPIPNGTVDFLDGATVIGDDIPLNASGVATFPYTLLGAGSHTITARYNGNTNYVTSASTPAVARTVDRANTSTLLATATNPSVFGQATVTATVTAVAPGGNVPTGNVTFSITNLLDSVTTQVQAALNASGVATLNPGLNAGTYSVSASFDGSANFNPSAVSNVINPLTINRADTTTTLATSNANSVYGAAIITAKVAPTLGSAIPTGTVTFNVTQGSTTTPHVVPLDALGVATLPPLDAGFYSITASYTGATNFNASNAGPITQNIVAADAQVTVGSNHNPSVFGQVVTLSALLSAVSPGFGVPTGTVDFIINGSTVGDDVPLVNGQASINISTLTVAGSPHNVQVLYNGSNNFNISNSALAGGQVVTKGNVVGTPASSLNPSPIGTPVTFSATIAAAAPASGIPDGTANLVIDNVTVQSNVPLVGNLVTFAPVSGLTLGQHNVFIRYNGGSNFAAGDSTILVQNVKGSTSTFFTAIPASTVFGQGVVFSTTVAPVFPAGGTPNGTVTFTIDAGTPSEQTFVANLVAGVAQTPSITNLTVGNHTVAAVYNGNSIPDSYFGSSTVANLLHNVTKASTGTTVTQSAGSTAYGQSATFTATIIGNPPGAVSGFVEFIIDGNFSNPLSRPVSGNQAVLTINTLSAGAHTVQANYLGDSNFQGSGGMLTPNHVVNPAATSMTLTQSVVATFVEQVVSFTSAVSVTAPGVGPATGQVQFFANGNPIGAPVPVPPGPARLDINTLPVGTHSITATFTDLAGNFATTTSSAVNHTVRANPVSFVVVPTSVKSGTAFSVTVHYKNGANPDTSFNGPVTLAINNGPDGGTLTGVLTKNASRGVVTFTGLKLNKTGDYTLRATANNLPAVVSNLITVNASSVILAVAPSKPLINELITFNANAVDINGNLATNYNGDFTITVTKKPTGSTITGPKTGTFVDGQAQLQMSMNKAGKYTIRLNGPAGVVSTIVISILGRRR